MLLVHRMEVAVEKVVVGHRRVSSDEPDKLSRWYDARDERLWPVEALGGDEPRGR